MTTDEISKFLNSHNYDVRVSGNARWIDQKCAADVVTIIADCILNYIEANGNIQFTTKDIWQSKYTKDNVEAIFKKPGVLNLSAKNEYDKFFQQPMELLSYAGILKRSKNGLKNNYQVVNQELLEYIAFKERHALTFLQLYIEKVLKDSGLLDKFTKFFKYQDVNTYHEVKDAFEDFTIKYTKINNKVECRRIFIKVINPLAFLHNSLGTESGRLSKNAITFDMLMYNRNNFRDIGVSKPKGKTRQEHSAKIKVAPSKAYIAYNSAKAKDYVRRFNNKYRNGLSEVNDTNHMKDPAVHIHHIFPESQFSTISAHFENLIALTPTQHLSYAHPKGNTQRIDLDYQHKCILSKIDNIETTFNSSNIEKIYDFSKLKFVLKTGFKNEVFDAVEYLDFEKLRNLVNANYKK